MRTCVFTIALLVCLAGTASASPGVLVLFSDERVMPANIELDTAIRQELGLPKADIEYSAEFFDTTRFNEPGADIGWRDFLKQKYAGHDIRALIAVAPQALEFLIHYQPELFPGRPVIVIAVPANRLGDRPLPANFLVLHFTYEYAGTLALARRLQPGAKEIVVAVGTTEIDKVYQAQLRRELPSGPGALPVRYLEGLSLEDIVRELSTLSRDSIDFIIPIFRDGAGRARIPLDTAAEIEAASGAPSYSAFSTTLGIGVVGGQMTTYAHMGRWAGQMIQRLLNGYRLADLESPAAAPSSVVVDWRALQRWGLDEARLPAGAEVRFKTPTLWQQYRGLIVTVSSLVMLLAVSLVALLVQRQRRDVAEAEVHTVRNELAHLTRVSLMGELSASLAHELNQPLTAILTNTQAAERFLQSPQPDLDTVRAILADIVDDDRRAGEVISRLREQLKKGEPNFQSVQCAEIVDSVLRLANSDLMSREVTITTKVDAGLPPVNGDRIQLQQVLLNLIMNAADAVKTLPKDERHITIRASQAEDRMIELRVDDRGVGIPPDQLATVFEPFVTTKAEGLGMGLSISRTIAEAHGGRLFASNRDRGATLHLVLPAA
jgi:signal transduction histidine kinase